MSFLLVVILMSVLHYVFSSRRYTHECSSLCLLSRLYVLITTILVTKTNEIARNPRVFV